MRWLLCVLPLGGCRRAGGLWPGIAEKSSHWLLLRGVALARRACQRIIGSMGNCGAQIGFYSGVLLQT